MDKSEFYNLMDRLQKCSERLYSNKKWTESIKDTLTSAWIGHEIELKTHVTRLEEKLTKSNQHLTIVKDKV